ncbi:MAG: hypothetical protein CVV57_03100 [Tenericutes bacterium HGW-Tenericutes-2]|jgi:hypothetical protein|nr:MAG: hypothetical protein CVV57_03100 [Tenericutes bacterium HGW-Tenericutes-2]
MSNIIRFIKELPSVTNAKEYGVYPLSVNHFGHLHVFMIHEGDQDFLIATGIGSSQFEGELFQEGEFSYVKAPLIHHNANTLRDLFPFTKPIPVLNKLRSFGLGDRLGIATEGHIRVFKEYDAYPIFAQQSIRELALTNRTYKDVLDAASFSVFRDGYKDGFGADGDHLKKASEVEMALNLGFSMITLDCSEFIRNDVTDMTKDQVNHACKLDDEIKNRYLKHDFEVEGMKISFDEEELKRNVLVYGKAIDFAVQIYQDYFADDKTDANFEISIDETATPTTPTQHYFVANELTRRGVKLDTMAPRFCGEFQKGVDYIGDIKQFEVELKIHAAIARHYGYKLSIHSGSDKFSIFQLVGKYTRGHFHVKTAGTNWLEAMRAVAATDPKLYREIHKYALSMFEEAKKFYHVTTDLTKIANVDTLTDDELVDLFKQNDARQLIHITYGFILNAKNQDDSFRFKTKLYDLWREKREVYADMLYQHIGRHLELLYSGFEK